MKKCRNCGAEYPGNDARFCENCGSPLIEVEENEEQQEPISSEEEADEEEIVEETEKTAEETPEEEAHAAKRPKTAKQPKPESAKIPKPDMSKIPVDKIGSFVKNPKYLKYIAGGVAAVAIVAVAANFMGCGKTKINLNDYLTVDYYGYDSVGTAECYFDAYSVYEDNSKAFRSKSGKNREAEDFYEYLNGDGSYVAGVLESAAKPKLDKKEDLSNGDKVTCEWKINEDMLDGLEETYGVIFKYGDLKEKVKELKEVEEVDIFEQLNVSYDGYEGYGSATATGTERFYGLEYPMKAQDAANGELSNGDKLTINITAPEDTENDLEKYIIRNYGVKPEKLEKEYTVSGLDELEEFDPFEKLDVRFTGRSPFLNMELSNNNKIYGIEFRADETEGLAIGDEVVVTAVGAEGEVLENICAAQGKKLVQDKKTYIVEKADGYVEKLEDISQEEMDKMERTARSAVEDAAVDCWYWDNTGVKLTNTEFIGNYFLKAKKNADVDHYTYIFFVYKITGTAEDGTSYTSYSYSRFRDMIRLSDGTFSVDLQDEKHPARYVDSVNYHLDGIHFAGYPELDSMFYDVVTCNSDNFDYVSTVTE